MTIKVSDALRSMLVTGPGVENAGICVQVDSAAMRAGASFREAGDVDQLFFGYKAEAIASWPEATDDPSFPVPAPGKGKDGDAAERYYWSYKHKMWAQSEYGNSRRRLLRHLIVWFKERGM